MLLQIFKQIAERPWKGSGIHCLFIELILKQNVSSVLQDEKTEIGKKLKQSKEQLQSFETQLKEAEETKSTDTKGDQNPNFIKILRKSEKLTELESKVKEKYFRYQSKRIQRQQNTVKSRRSYLKELKKSRKKSTSRTTLCKS